MKKNLLSCLVAASLVFGVGASFVQNTAVYAEDAAAEDVAKLQLYAGSAKEVAKEGETLTPVQEAYNKAIDDANTEVAKETHDKAEVAAAIAAFETANNNLTAEKNKKAQEAAAAAAAEKAKKAAIKTELEKTVKENPLVTETSPKRVEYNSAVRAAVSALANYDAAELTSADVQALIDAVNLAKKMVEDENKPHGPASNEVRAREVALAGAEQSYEEAENARCDFSIQASEKSRLFFGKHIAELKALIDKFDTTKVEDTEGLQALLTAKMNVEGLTYLYRSGAALEGGFTGTPDSATEFNELLHKLQDKVAAAKDLQAAMAITDTKDPKFLKYFGCYTAAQIKKGEHVSNLRGLREAIIEAEAYVTCDTEVLAPKIKYEIASLQAYLDAASKCKAVVPADPKNVGKTGTTGAAGKSAPALPATGEVATALPLVLFASASVLTALRKKH